MPALHPGRPRQRQRQRDPRRRPPGPPAGHDRRQPDLRQGLGPEHLLAAVGPRRTQADHGQVLLAPQPALQRAGCRSPTCPSSPARPPSRSTTMPASAKRRIMATRTTTRSSPPPSARPESAVLEPGGRRSPLNQDPPHDDVGMPSSSRRNTVVEGRRPRWPNRRPEVLNSRSGIRNLESGSSARSPRQTESGRSMSETAGRTSRIDPETAWTVVTDSPLKGMALAREAGTILAWDEGNQLYLFDLRGRVAVVFAGPEPDPRRRDQRRRRAHRPAGRGRRGRAAPARRRFLGASSRSRRRAKRRS